MQNCAVSNTHGEAQGGGMYARMQGTGPAHLLHAFPHLFSEYRLERSLIPAYNVYALELALRERANKLHRDEGRADDDNVLPFLGGCDDWVSISPSIQGRN